MGPVLAHEYSDGARIKAGATSAEHKAHRRAPWLRRLGRLLYVEATRLRKVQNDADPAVEFPHQILGPPADGHETMTTQGIGSGRVCLERREPEKFDVLQLEPRQSLRRVARIEPASLAIQAYTNVSSDLDDRNTPEADQRAQIYASCDSQDLIPKEFQGPKPKNSDRKFLRRSGTCGALPRGIDCRAPIRRPILHSTKVVQTYEISVSSGMKPRQTQKQTRSSE